MLPNLTAYHSIKKIRAIQDTKMEERRKEAEKAERDGKKVTFNEDEEEKKMSNEEIIMKKRVDDKLNTNTSLMSEAQKEKEREREEVATYGVRILYLKCVAYVGLGWLF